MYGIVKEYMKTKTSGTSKCACAVSYEDGSYKHKIKEKEKTLYSSGASPLIINQNRTPPFLILQAKSSKEEKTQLHGWCRKPFIGFYSCKDPPIKPLKDQQMLANAFSFHKTFNPLPGSFPSIASFFILQLTHRNGPSKVRFVTEKNEPAWTEIPSLNVIGIWQIAQLNTPDDGSDPSLDKRKTNHKIKYTFQKQDLNRQFQKDEYSKIWIDTCKKMNTWKVTEKTRME